MRSKTNLKTDYRNALYCVCSANPWLDVAKKLESELNISPKYFIGRNDKSVQIKKDYPDCFFQVLEDAWDGKNFPNLDYKCSIDENLMKSIAFEQGIALSMMNRLDLDRNSFPYSNRQDFFYLLLARWMVILKEYEIDIIISPSVPHRVFDYVLYIVAKLKGITFVMFEMTPFADSGFIFDDICCIPDYLKIGAENFGGNKKLRDDIEARIKTVRGHYEDAIPDYMKENAALLRKRRTAGKIINLVLKPRSLFSLLLHLLKVSTVYYVSRNRMPYDRKQANFYTLLKIYQNRSYLKKLKNTYDSLVVKSYRKKYVLVALHYQPEATSNPTGGLYANQKTIVSLLDSCLDEDTDIIVKEHKSQFHPHFEGATSRGEDYYHDLLAISNRVKLVNVDCDPFRLIDGAIATVTISGTIGWESAIRGKPVLIFGRAWYEGMEGVYKVKSSEDIISSWKSISSQSNSIRYDHILNYHKNLQKFLIDAPYYPDLLGKSDRSHHDNVRNIVDGIKSYLSRELK